MSFQELIESKEVSYCSAVKAVKCGVVDSFVTVVRRICQSQRYDMDLLELLHAMSMLLYVFLSDEQKQAEV